MAKYKGREEVFWRRVSLLDCGWSEVVQLLPLHPGKLFQLQYQLGLITSIPKYSYFQIDPSVLNPEATVVYFKTAPGEQHATVKCWGEVSLEELQTAPRATAEYYKTMVGTGQPVFNYQFVPHVLYRGSIDISDCPRIHLEL